MDVRESRLLIIAVVMGAFVAIPLACGGSDNGGDNTNQNGDSNNNGGDNVNGGDNRFPTGGDSPSGGDTTSQVEQDCTTVVNKFTSCQATFTCDLPTQLTVQNCVDEGGFPASAVSIIQGATCDQLDELFCPHFTSGECTGGNICVAIDAFTGICTTSTGATPTGAEDCSSGDHTCTDATQVCAGSSDNDSNDSCYAQCAPPACTNSLQCQIVDTDGDTACMTSTGDFGADAPTCTHATDCAPNAGCLTIDSVSKCVTFCFLNDGTAVESVHSTTVKQLMKF